MADRRRVHVFVCAVDTPHDGQEDQNGPRSSPESPLEHPSQVQGRPVTRGAREARQGRQSHYLPLPGKYLADYPIHVMDYPNHHLPPPSKPLLLRALLLLQASTPRVVTDIMALLAEHGVAITTADRVYDLGSGDGPVLIGIAKATGAKCIGNPKPNPNPDPHPHPNSNRALRRGDR